MLRRSGGPEVTLVVACGLETGKLEVQAEVLEDPAATSEDGVHR